MRCNKCQTNLIEVVRYDGDKMISSRLCCPLCDNEWPEREDFESISARLFNTPAYA